ncbi:hypothetical protein [Pyxidicoccus sp. MSG2]|uniref:hypothetical protein n=1 Tax=Pyxidicoccus sp. MSG2 TaxID=2996790 RepID=UPI0022700B74|nr:hypothetical protein [Pyxidicoccus sp. MSG2]MCY1019281.1 hypothetical protein [Pyxidicoccus sp. MSG2]
MGRYVFKAKDLAPLRAWIDTPIARQVLESAVPVKRFDTQKVFREEPIELPVSIQSRDTPDGVPLHDILKAVQAEDPTISGITVRGDRLVLKHATKPLAGQRDKVRELLKDSRKLNALRPQQPPKPQALKGESLEKLLLDDETPDAEWLRAFRRYAVANLIKPSKRTSK